MPITLDPGLYREAKSPWRYDLDFVCDETPRFVLTAFPADICAMSARKLGTEENPFRSDEESVGFNGMFSRANLVLPIDGAGSWAAQLPADPEEVNSELVRQLSLSIGAMCGNLRFAPARENSAGIQQLAVHLLSDGPSWGISTTFSPVVRHWIETNRDYAVTVGQKAMVTTGEKVWSSYFIGDQHSAAREFMIRCNEGRGVLFRVPGVASVGVDGSEFDEGPGWHMTPHNVDGPSQQLCLFSGICALTHRVRESQLQNR